MVKRTAGEEGDGGGHVGWADAASSFVVVVSAGVGAVVWKYGGVVGRRSECFGCVV